MLWLDKAPAVPKICNGVSIGFMDVWTQGHLLIPLRYFDLHSLLPSPETFSSCPLHSFEQFDNYWKWWGDEEGKRMNEWRWGSTWMWVKGTLDIKRWSEGGGGRVKTVSPFQPQFTFTHTENHLRFQFREDINRKKHFLSGIARIRGGGLPMPKFFGPLFRSAFLVNKKSLFLQKCQCIEF